MQYNQSNTTDEISNKTNTKKILLTVGWVFVVLAAIAILAPTILGFFSKDITPIDDSDLALSVVSVPKEENAYFDMTKAVEVMYNPDWKLQEVQSLLSGEVWNDALAKEIILKNSKAMRHLVAASRKPKFQDPALADPKNITPDALVPPLSNWRNLAKISVIYAEYFAKEGRWSEAMEAAMVPARVGQKMQKSQVNMIEYLVALAMKRIGLEAAQDVLAQSTLPTEAIKRYIKELDEFYDNESGLVSAYKMGYHIISTGIDWASQLRENEELDLLMDILKSKDVDIENEKEVKKIVKKYLDVNATKLLFADPARKRIKMVVGPCSEVSSVETRKLSPKTTKEFYETENAIGKMIYDIVEASFITPIIKKCEEDALVGVTQVMFAIKAFHNDTGVYPDTIADLVPEYLKEIPQDPFDGGDMKYSKEKNILYSIGRDLKDNGGTVSGDRKKMSDLVFKISF